MTEKIPDIPSQKTADNEPRDDKPTKDGYFWEKLGDEMTPKELYDLYAKRIEEINQEIIGKEKNITELKKEKEALEKQQFKIIPDIKM